MNSAIVIFPKFQNIDIINEFRQKYDPLADKIAPHITLVFPFESQISTSELRKHMQQTISDIQPFAIKLCGIREHDNKYLFLNVINGNDQIIKLHDWLYTGILSKHLLKEITYVPHLTIGCIDNENEFHRILHTVKFKDIEFETKITHISVMQINTLDILKLEFEVRL